jgi:hypothetical protein
VRDKYNEAIGEDHAIDFFLFLEQVRTVQRGTSHAQLALHVSIEKLQQQRVDHQI